MVHLFGENQRFICRPIRLLVSTTDFTSVLVAALSSHPTPAHSSSFARMLVYCIQTRRNYLP